jgi:type VI secretion system secreted protein VgrG
MPDAKSGKAGSAVAPAAPKEAEEADKADPGEVEKIKAEQRQAKTGKYGSEKVKPPESAEGKDKDKEKKMTWIEIQMLDEAGKPVTGMAYRVTPSDGSPVEGTLDEKGTARVDGVDPGTCQVTFPNLDKDAWEKS